ncbi:hypothetical protein CLV24_11740 [Pontibacter ummariensis]|uniref:Uncharacterized protein n=1 Tax=Pontibacter ummariensis TaxID=1610492 RepID=A0A239IJM2_9BACT|nr:hypothetical protein [Pontibacter ummariensis]PRY09836.1 hypothetical protein CLV24_11740 [Pontibacter ummariensis]SNS92634.1 hypothetical protein SAMN06296052_11740 [Pontibacter ummariensis]
MIRVRLEIDKVRIHRPKERWRLYFVILAEHPDGNDKMILTTLPQEPFRLSPRHNNSYSFDTDQVGAEGLFVLSREIPEDRELNVHIYLRHTRKSTRNLGEILKEVESGIGGDAFGIVQGIAGTATVPWLIIAKRAVPLVGKILTSIPDRDFGFLSAFERFGSEFEEQGEIDREKNFTGDASLVYSWSVDEHSVLESGMATK